MDRLFVWVLVYVYLEDETLVSCEVVLNVFTKYQVVPILQHILCSIADYS